VVDCFEIFQDERRAALGGGLQPVTHLAGVIGIAAGALEGVHRLVEFIPQPGLDELKEVLALVQHQRIVHLRPQPGMDAQLAWMGVFAARVMFDIQVDFGRERDDLSTDFRFLGVDEHQVNVGGVAQEWVPVQHRTGQVGGDDVVVGIGALDGSLFGDLDH